MRAGVVTSDVSTLMFALTGFPAAPTAGFAPTIASPAEGEMSMAKGLFAAGPASASLLSDSCVFERNSMYLRRRDVEGDDRDAGSTRKLLPVEPLPELPGRLPVPERGENTTSLPAICASVRPAAALSPIRPA